MKYKVVDGFLDIKTNEYKAVGEILTDEETRIKDFLNAGVIEEIEDEKKETLTLKEIKSLLDEKKIAYDKKAAKEELLMILNGAE